MASNPNTPSQSGAKTHVIDWRARVRATFEHHQEVAVTTLLRLLKQPVASVMTWLVIAIALTLPGALWMTMDNLEQLGGRFQAFEHITLYLDKTVTNTKAEQLTAQIKRLPNVSNVEFIDAQSALEQFKTQSGMSDILELLPDNPLPSMILVEPPLALSSEKLQTLTLALGALSGIDDVQMDMAWVERLLAMMALGKRTVVLLGGLLALSILLVVGNTIRLAIAARVDEIRVVKLVGGTNAYVRRPFLYTGLWFGFMGGLMSWVLLALGWALMHGPVNDIAALYDAQFELKPLPASIAVSLLVGAMLLGWLGAWWSVHRHLHRIEPE